MGLRQQVVGLIKRKPPKVREFTLGKHLCCIGICIRAALVDENNHELFRYTMGQSHDLPTSCFGARFKVPKTRYEVWRRYVTLNDFTDASTDP